MFLKCPSCDGGNICAQNRAFVTQWIDIDVDGELIYEPWTSEDVAMTDSEWYVCRDCGDHYGKIDPFRIGEDRIYTLPDGTEISAEAAIGDLRRVHSYVSDARNTALGAQVRAEANQKIAEARGEATELLADIEQIIRFMTFLKRAPFDACLGSRSGGEIAPDAEVAGSP